MEPFITDAQLWALAWKIPAVLAVAGVSLYAWTKVGMELLFPNRW